MAVYYFDFIRVAAVVHQDPLLLDIADGLDRSHLEKSL